MKTLVKILVLGSLLSIAMFATGCGQAACENGDCGGNSGESDGAITADAGNNGSGRSDEELCKLWELECGEYRIGDMTKDKKNDYILKCGTCASGNECTPLSSDSHISWAAAGMCVPTGQCDKYLPFNGWWCSSENGYEKKSPYTMDYFTAPTKAGVCEIVDHLDHVIYANPDTLLHEIQQLTEGDRVDTDITDRSIEGDELVEKYDNTTTYQGQVIDHITSEQRFKLCADQSNN